MFGEINFISLLKWKKKKQPSYLHGQVAGLMEYILVYGKKITKVDNLSLGTRKNINTRVDNSSNAINKIGIPFSWIINISPLNSINRKVY